MPLELKPRNGLMASRIISVTEFKAKAAQILAEIKVREHTVVLTQNGRATAVVQAKQHRRRQDQASA